MTKEEAINLIYEEYESDNGLDLMFRMSADVEPARMANFIAALKCLEQHYAGEEYIERKLAGRLFSMHQTLQGSQSHWKVSRPEGLDRDTCWEVFTTIRHILWN